MGTPTASAQQDLETAQHRPPAADRQSHCGCGARDSMAFLSDPPDGCEDQGGARIAFRPLGYMRSQRRDEDFGHSRPISPPRTQHKHQNICDFPWHPLTLMIHSGLNVHRDCRTNKRNLQNVVTQNLVLCLSTIELFV